MMHVSCIKFYWALCYLIALYMFPNLCMKDERNITSFLLFTAIDLFAFEPMGPNISRVDYKSLGRTAEIKQRIIALACLLERANDAWHTNSNASRSGMSP